MPKVSNRARALNRLLGLYRRARACFVLDDIVDATDDESLDLESPAFLSYIHFWYRLRALESSRYSVPRVLRKHDFCIFERDLEEREDKKHWLNDEEFLRKYRMSREQLDAVTELIANHGVFEKQKKGRAQADVKYQLMVLLHFVGREGETNESQRNTFHISRGACEKYRDRCVTALCSMRDKYICWPDEDERKVMAARIEKGFKLPNCVGIMDGTLAELGICPECTDSADYNGRKFGYSLTILVINDDQREIRAYLSGFPGSAHDNRVWKNMPQYQEPEKFFGPVEYITADTAFEPSVHCIPTYKKQPGFVLAQCKEIFNTEMGSLRVITEHCMGLWKGRFGWMRKIRMRITDDPESLKRVLMYIEATIILHNIMIRLRDKDIEHPDWNIRDDDVSRMDDAERLPEERVLDFPLPATADGGMRREQLCDLINERHVPRSNYRPLSEIDGNEEEIESLSWGDEEEVDSLSWGDEESEATVDKGC
ncbi:hypothetical protein ACHAWF_010854 [Thalassiosira exigua]